MDQTISPVISVRKKEIVQQYITELDKHIAELKEGKVSDVMEINEFAALLHIHPGHLSNTIKEVTGQSSCDLFESRLLSTAKELLLTPNMTIAQVARQLTYDPSNFTKFFKQYSGITPKQFRNQHAAAVKS
jgi:AraC-like DNA-binding protein